MSEAGRSRSKGLGDIGAGLLVDLVERTTTAIGKLVELEAKTELAIARIDATLADHTPVLENLMRELATAPKRADDAITAVKGHVTEKIKDAVVSTRWAIVAAALLITVGELFQGAGLRWLYLAGGR